LTSDEAVLWYGDIKHLMEDITTARSVESCHDHPKGSTTSRSDTARSVEPCRNHRQAPGAARSLWEDGFCYSARKSATIHPKSDITTARSVESCHDHPKGSTTSRSDTARSVEPCRNHRQAPGAARSLWEDGFCYSARKSATIHPKSDTSLRYYL